MFREMRRIKQALSEQECIDVLTQAPRGVLAVHGEDGYPYTFPMNHIYMDGKLYFHCAREGHKIDAIAADNKVSFCVMDEGFRKEGEWALNIKSVVIFGKIAEVKDEEERVRIMRALGLKYHPTVEFVEHEISRAMSRVQILELSIDHMTGKLAKES